MKAAMSMVNESSPNSIIDTKHVHVRDSNVMQQTQTQTNTQTHAEMQSTHLTKDEPEKSSVQVAIRIRPLLKFEDDHECIRISGSNDNDNDGTGTGRPKLVPALSSDSTLTTLQQQLSDSTGLASSPEDELDPSSRNSAVTLPRGNVNANVNVGSSYQTVQVGEGENAPGYTFDHVFPSSTDQGGIYNRCVTPLVQSCLEGYNATVLAYGQTGSGKTYTMLGDVDHDENDVGVDIEEEGMIPRALRNIFGGLEEFKTQAALHASTKEGEMMDSPQQRRSTPSKKIRSSTQSRFNFWNYTGRRFGIYLKHQNQNLL
jgi:hypothetical protein